MKRKPINKDWSTVNKKVDEDYYAWHNSKNHKGIKRLYDKKGKATWYKVKKQ